MYTLLYNYLLDHPTVFTRDSNGKRIPFDRNELTKEYEGVAILSTNLRPDSVHFDKSAEGIYKFGYASLSEPRWLYLKYRDHVEFIDLNEESLDMNRILKRIHRFFRKTQSFTEKEKIIMVQRAMEVIYDNVYETYSW